MANTKGSDNPFPSILIVEGTEPTAPSAGQQRLYIDSTTHLLKLTNSSGADSNVGGGLTDPMTTRGDIIVRNASNVTARLGRGSASQVLTSDGTDVAWAAAGSGGAPMTLTEATLGADVTMTSADTFYDGPTITPAAGTYDVWARITFGSISAAQQYFVGRIIANSSTVVDESMIQWVTANTSQLELILAGRVVANGTNPILVRGASSNASQLMKRDPTVLSSTIHRATLLRIQKVA
jgi:hypothetical protein